MKAITHFEVYAVKLGVWALHSRFSGEEREQAESRARALEKETGRPAQVLEETQDPETGEVAVRIVLRSSKPAMGAKGPAADASIGGRILMVVVNSLGIGALVTILVAVGMSSAGDRGAIPAGAYGILLLLTFAAVGIIAGVMLFKIYVPVELVLWRAKDAAAQQKILRLLIYGTDEPDPEPVSAPAVARAPPPAAPNPEPQQEDASLKAAEPGVRRETNADQGEETSFHFAAADDYAVIVDTSSEAPAVADGAGDLMASVLAPYTTQLGIFADAASATLAATRPELQAFERFGFNLYLTGAAIAVADRAQLAGDLKRLLAEHMLRRAGTGEATARSFCERLDTLGDRPRYGKLMEAGRAALVAQADENSPTPHAALPELIQQWADPIARGGKTERVTFLLTDLVGSTALTSKIGNSAAQRVVRAHNAVVREATKDFKGKEIKHTGDGLLVTFPDAAAAAKAAIDIQQESVAYAKDNPEAPLSLRVGLHAGEATWEEGEYYGESVMLLDGICGACDAGQIACTQEIRSRVGSAFRFTDAGMKTLKGTEIERQIFLLEWLPKPTTPKGPIEYRQIGTRPTQPAV